MTEFARLTAQFELSGFPEGLDALYDQYAVDYQPHALMRRGLIGELCARFDAGTQNERRLFEALDEIEGNPELLKLSNFLVNDMCAARHRLDLDDYQAMEPKKGARGPLLLPVAVRLYRAIHATHGKAGDAVGML